MTGNSSATLKLAITVKGITAAEAIKIGNSGGKIKSRVLNEVKDTLAVLGIPHDRVEFVPPTGANVSIPPVERVAKATHEPGLPLRQFIRGFLRDHMGLSKIMAHAAADIFMKRWDKKDPATIKRYSQEDVHTREAIFDRKSIEKADEVFKGQVGPDLLARMKNTSPEKLDALEELARIAASGDFRFPDRPTGPVRSGLFGQPERRHESQG